MKSFFEIFNIYKLKLLHILSFILFGFLKCSLLISPIFIANKNRNFIYVFVVLLFLYGIFEILNSYIKYKISLNCRYSELNYKTKLLSSIKHISLVDYESSSLKTSIFRAKNFIDNYSKTVNSVIETIVNFSIILSILMLILFINPYIFLVYFTTIFVFTYLRLQHNKKNIHIWKNYMENSREHNELNKILIDKSYALERKVFNVFNFLNPIFLSKFNKSIAENKKDGFSRLKDDLIFEFSSFLLFIIILISSLYLYFNKYIDFSYLYITLVSISTLYFSLGEELNKSSNYQNELYNYKSYVKIIDLMEKTKDEIEIKNYNIEFKNVYFKYPNSSDYVIRDFSFKFEYRKNYTILGKNGCGKSTLIKLLLGLYPVESGTVTIGEVDINSLNDKQKAKIFSVLFQKPKIYPFTVADNITLNKDLSKCEDFSNTLDENLNKYILSLKEGYNSKVSKNCDNVINFSGGQWQKIFFSRVYMKNSKIFIFDEPTSNLDAIAEMKYYNDVSKLIKDNLNIFISHRMGIVKYCDEILFIENGQVIENGTHENLVESRGKYFEMYMAQKEMYKI